MGVLHTISLLNTAIAEAFEVTNELRWNCCVWRIFYLGVGWAKLKWSCLINRQFIKSLGNIYIYVYICISWRYARRGTEKPQVQSFKAKQFNIFC